MVKAELERVRKDRLLKTLRNLIDYVRYSINEEISDVFDGFLAEKNAENLTDLENEVLEEFIYVLLNVLKEKRASTKIQETKSMLREGFDKETREAIARERLVDTVGYLSDYVRYTTDEDINDVLRKFLSSKGVKWFSDIENEEYEELIYILLDILKEKRK